MADNIQIPQDVAKVIKIEVKDTSDLMRKFLTDITLALNTINKKLDEFETRIKALEP